MDAMTCEEFEANEMDALHGDCDAATAAAFDAHMATCDRCRSRHERLRATRTFPSLVLEPAPAALEARILAAVDAAVPPPAAPARASAGAQIFAFLSKPQLAMAAAVLLVLGAGAIFLRRASERAPAAQAVAGADENTAAKAAAPPSPVATAAPTTAASAVVVAAADAPSPRSAAMGAAVAKPTDPAFSTAKALYDDGNCKQALPKLEALAKSNAEADLDAARCVEQLRGCQIAAGRYDTVARRNAGTEIASRASLESARCYGNAGNVALARSRYEALENDPHVAAEAKANLDSLEALPAAAPAAAPARPAATTTTRARPANVP